MRVLYNLGLYFLVLGTLLRKRSRKIFRQRMGRGFPKINKEGRPLIWVHAVSLGETKAVQPLIRKLKALPSRPKILLTAVTMTGHMEGKRGALADYIAFLPFDLPWVIKPIVKQVAPDLVILTETDFWANFQRAARKVILVNGKISERSFNRLKALTSAARLLLDSIDLFCLQGPVYAERFLGLGVPEERVEVTGNLKLDGLLEPVGEPLWHAGDLVFTAGSTHDPEERIILEALRPLWGRFPDLKVLIVPRHPERFDEVAALLQKENISSGRYSQGATLQTCRLLLIDAMGKLRSCYAASAVAFVGGSFAAHVGGHNILEPCAYKVPVLFGPYMYSQPDFLKLVLQYKCGLQVTSETLRIVLEELLTSKEKREEMGAQGERLIAESKGALDKTLREIESAVKL